jgi:hypothetical protein
LKVVGDLENLIASSFVEMKLRAVKRAEVELSIVCDVGEI